MSDLPIGVFDSGLGGLTVVRAIYERLPDESTLYFGDTARVPYGPKSPETVRRYSLEILHWLLSQHVKAVVIACNTSTAHALDALRAVSPVPVIGVIEPGSRAAVAAAPQGTIGVIGTVGTIASGAYERAIHQRDPVARVLQQACPLFVPLVEEGWFEHPAAELVAREYLAPLAAEQVQALVLGCTHLSAAQAAPAAGDGAGYGAHRQRRRDGARAREGARARGHRGGPGAAVDASLRGERRRATLSVGRIEVHRGPAARGGRRAAWLTPVRA
jgi:glutamate racemase